MADALKKRQQLNDILESLRHRGLKLADLVELQSVACQLPDPDIDPEQECLEKEMLKISERERQQVSHELHDDLGQHLIGIEALSTLLAHRLEQSANPESSLSKEIAELIRDAIIKTRTMAKDLCPVIMDEGGLTSALREFVVKIEKVFAIRCRLECDKSISIRNNVAANHLYNIVQEAVDNAIRHGKATEVIVRLTADAETVRLSIQDNGAGMPQHRAYHKGLGTGIMEYRARKVGATLEIERNSEGGTTVICTIPRSG